MLRLAELSLSDKAQAALARAQKKVDDAGNYPAQVAKAKKAWDSKPAAFNEIRQVLAKSCVGAERCHYCEDSKGDEIEHIRPKDLFPERVFVWSNYLFACGPCNGPKNNRYGYVENGQVNEFVRGKDAPIVPPPQRSDALIDPRREDPLNFLELDIGGVSPDGLVVEGEFEFQPLFEADPLTRARATHTIDILGLNRQFLIDARTNAFGGFRARVREYLDEKLGGAAPATLSRLRKDLLDTPHLSVFAEMQRKHAVLDFMSKAVAVAPELLEWQLIPA